MLAIAGLIFLMVFLALPALQRSQRDTQRKDDVARLQTALNSYQANNRNQLPQDAVAAVNVIGADTQALLRTANNVPNPAGDSWVGFYERYLLVGSAGATDIFADPDGTAYSLRIVTCAAGADCAQVDATWDAQTNRDPSHAILVVRHAICQGERIVFSSGARKVAIAYKLEGGGVTCVNN